MIMRAHVTRRVCHSRDKWFQYLFGDKRWPTPLLSASVAPRGGRRVFSAKMIVFYQFFSRDNRAKLIAMGWRLSAFDV